ncbi:MAG: EI24 domain-containing protein [Betaproteobacteria bacterium]|nr:EI24 domain-containing protein [Betaproteobacteria bacterium]
MSIARSLAYAFANLLHPRMLWLMLWPVLLSLVLWAGVGFFLFGWIVVRLAAKIDAVLHDTMSFLTLDLTDWTLIAAKVIVYLAFIPLVYMTALVILGIFGMPAMVDHVAGRSFPALKRRQGGGVLGSAWNAVVTLLGMAALVVVTVPLWLFPPLWPLIPLLVMAWANQRFLRYDALAEHADRAEMSAIFRERRGPLYGLGFLMALTAYLPLVGFFVPALFALAFIHYLLSTLDQRRLSQPSQ